jgi:hypothetical protein
LAAGRGRRVRRRTVIHPGRTRAHRHRPPRLPDRAIWPWQGLGPTPTVPLMYPASAWFAAFALTVIVEAPFVLYAARRHGVDWVRGAVILVLANLATHPVLWYVIPQVVVPRTTQFVAVGEGWAIAAETACYWAVIPGMRARSALAVALLANVASFGVGRLVAGVAPELFR